jgi:glycogen synthase
MLEALGNAAITYMNHTDKWQKIVHTCMEQDFSWKESAKKYIALYQHALSL